MVRERRFFEKSSFIYLILFFVSVHSYAPAGEDWRIRKSSHFIVHYKNSSYRFLDRLVNKAEDSYRLITQSLGFLRDEPWLWEKRALIYVYDTKDEYIAASDFPEWSVGFARPFEKTIYTYAESYDFLKYVLVHELTHLIFREFVGRVKVPLWFEEGVATYMERKKAAPQLVWQTRYLLKNEKLIDFDDFLHITMEDLGGERNPKDELGNQNMTGRFYLQSFSCVYFLFNEFDKYKFVELLRKIKKEGDFDDAFFATYWALKDERGFEARWKQFYQ